MATRTPTERERYENKLTESQLCVKDVYIFGKRERGGGGGAGAENTIPPFIVEA